MERRAQRIAHIPAQLWSLINRIDELKGQWIGGAQLNPQALGRLKRSALITSSGSSTRIEGAKLSDDDVEKLMRGLAMTKFADRDKQEVKGYYELLENVFNAWKHTSFSESTIKHFHKELLHSVSKDARHRGEYKKGENRVEIFDARRQSLSVMFARAPAPPQGGTVRGSAPRNTVSRGTTAVKPLSFTTTPAYLTPKRMQELVEWTQAALKKNTQHPLVVIANFLVEFLAIHPFQDGNGRLARILTNLLLLRCGYAYAPYVSHEKLIEDNKAAYYLSLQKSQRTLNTRRENIQPWLQFFLDVSLAQAKQAINLLSRENIEKLLSPKQLAVWHYLEKVAEATPAAITKATSVARPTVSQAIGVLLRLKKIERIGQGRTTRYRKVLS